MGKAKLIKPAVISVVTVGTAIAAPHIAPFLLLPLTSLIGEIFSQEELEKKDSIGKITVNAICSVLTNIASSAIWEAPDSFKSQQNEDLARALARAYQISLEQFASEIGESGNEILKAQADRILPLVRARVDRTVKENTESALSALFPLQKGGESAIQPAAEAFSNRLTSEKFILELANESVTVKQILTDEIEISVRRWFNEELAEQSKTTVLGIARSEELPEPLRLNIREKLSAAVPHHLGQTLKEADFQNSWIAFQRSHLQAILKEVKNNKRLSEDDKSQIMLLAEKLDRLSKIDGVPEKLAELSQLCLIRFDSLENIVKDQQAELLEAINKGNIRSLQEFEELKRQNDELKRQIAGGYLSLGEIKSGLARQSELIETLSGKFGDTEILKSLADDIRFLSEKINSFGKSLPNSIPSISGFVGRKDYLNELRESYQNGTGCFVLHGVGGVGKTATALEFAGEIADDFAAKVFVDMQGLSENPLSTRSAMFEVVRQFEREISVDIPEPQLRNLFVQFTQKQPTLIILDNAKGEAEVAPLVARAGACFIVSSRNDIQLSSGKTKRLVAMSPDDAEALLFSIAPKEKFEGKGKKLAQLAGYLPMALKPLAKLLKKRFKAIPSILKEYEQKRLEITDSEHDNLSVEASFALSYDALPVELKEHWRSLAVFPADFEEKGASTVFGIEYEAGREVLYQLYDYSLIEEFAKSATEQQRFILHDLARLFTDKQLSEDERFDTKFLHAKHYASVLGHAREIRSNDRENGFANALSLIDTEWSNITVGQQWAADFAEKDDAIAELCSNYSGVVNELIALRLHPRIFITWQETALKATRKLLNRQAEGNRLGDLGNCYWSLGEYRKAIEYYKKARKVFYDIDNRKGEQLVLINLGLTYESLGEYGKVIAYSKQALAIAHEINEQKGTDLIFGNLGAAYENLGEYQKAIKHYKKALMLARQMNERQREGEQLANLGSVYNCLSEHPKAIVYFEKALKIFNEIDYQQGKVKGYNGLGSAYVSSGEYPKAPMYHEQALTIARDIGDLHGEGSSLSHLGYAYFNLGEKKRACGLWKEALAILEAIESPHANLVREWLKENCGDE